MTVYPPEKQLVVSVGISKTSYREVVGLCCHWASQCDAAGLAAAHYICITSVHGIMLAKDDPEIARIFNEADIATPDGMPVVWALRTLGSPHQQRVYGPTLILELCRAGLRPFLYGGRPETLPLLIARLEREVPGLRVAGAYAPPFGPPASAEEQDIRARIQSSNADIVFVGIGAPKQERWMYEHRDCFPGLTLIGVGAAFDFLAGRTRQAPRWMQNNGLEWLFRLIAEPRRLWRRYLLITPRFLPLWALQLLRGSRPKRP
jgi:N-acetylglucosaminyldiphosphoundecaprenol N-acetyl-beta-D-mannosaminyltransferase